MRREIVTVNAPRISVVIPCFNQGRYLVEAISSAQLAYEGPLEVVVVDDGSTDPKTDHWLREAETLGGDIKIVRQANRGLSGARNAGIEASTGDFIQFLDADDLLVPGKLDAQIAHFLVSQRLDVSVCNFLLCDDLRNVFSKPDEAIAQFDLTLEDFLYRWERGFVIPIHCALFRRAVFNVVRFDEEARAKEDWIFWCTLVAGRTKLAYAAGHWAIYRQHQQSMRRSYVSMGKNWLGAALKLDALVGRTHPAFFEACVEWFDTCYRQHPTYQEEIKANRLRLTPASAQTAAAVSTGSSSDSYFVSKLVGVFEGLKVKNEKPLVTVVIPVYNHFEHFLGCLESLGSQGDADFEVICIDDASTDPRIGILFDTLSNKVPHIRLVRHAVNKGISASQNEAVELANGEFVAFLDCDDALEPRALEVVTQIIQNDVEIDYLFTDRNDIDVNGVHLRHAKYGGYPSLKPEDGRSVRDDLLDGMVASHLKVIRRSIYLAVGGTNDQYSGCQDWELALKIAETGKFQYLPQALYRHRVHASSVTQADRVAQFRKTNQLRRVFSQRWLRPDNHMSDSCRPCLVPNNDSEKVLCFHGKENLPSLIELKKAWLEGFTCSFDTRVAADLSVINFLREYNSYFDRVLWSDPAVPGALIGYLWSDQVLASSIIRSHAI